MTKETKIPPRPYFRTSPAVEERIKEVVAEAVQRWVKLEPYKTEYKRPWTPRDRALLVAGLQAWDRGETQPPPNKIGISH